MVDPPSLDKTCGYCEEFYVDHECDTCPLYQRELCRNDYEPFGDEIPGREIAYWTAVGTRDYEKNHTPTMRERLAAAKKLLAGIMLDSPNNNGWGGITHDNTRRHR